MIRLLQVVRVAQLLSVSGLGIILIRLEDNLVLDTIGYMAARLRLRLDHPSAYTKETTCMKWFAYRKWIYGEERCCIRTRVKRG